MPPSLPQLQGGGIGGTFQLDRSCIEARAGSCTCTAASYPQLPLPYISRPWYEHSFHLDGSYSRASLGSGRSSSRGEPAPQSWYSCLLAGSCTHAVVRAGRSRGTTPSRKGSAPEQGAPFMLLLLLPSLPCPHPIPSLGHTSSSWKL